VRGRPVDNIFMVKHTPDQSKTAEKDSKGVRYSEGNRHTRRVKAAGTTHKVRSQIAKNKQDTYKGPELPKELRKKDKSKFLGHRMREERVRSINEL
jgi:hypothetical protein